MNCCCIPVGFGVNSFIITILLLAVSFFYLSYMCLWFGLLLIQTPGNFKSFIEHCVADFENPQK